MELPSKISEQISFNTGLKIQEHMLIVVDKSTHEEHLSHALQNNNKQYKNAVTFLTGDNGFSNVTNSNIKFHFMKLNTDDIGSVQITIPPVAYDVESLNNQIKRIINDEGHYTEAYYPFTMKPSFSTLGCIIEISPQEPIISFMLNDSIRVPLGFHAITLYE